MGILPKEVYNKTPTDFNRQVCSQGSDQQSYSGILHTEFINTCTKIKHTNTENMILCNNVKNESDVFIS